MNTKLLFALILLFYSVHVTAQRNFFFKHLNRENGLSNSTVETIMQDSRGFIWIGTQDGLNRYDGYQFTVFQSQNQVKKIFNNFITHITEDSRKRLWVATISGVALYDLHLDNFLEKHLPGANNVELVYETNKGLILAATTYGLNYYNEDKQKFEIFSSEGIKKSRLADKHITAIMQDQEGNYWIGTYGSGIYIFRPDFSFSHSLTENNSKLAGNYINCLATDTLGNIWVGYLNKGLDMIQKNTVTHFSHDERDNSSLPGETIKAIYTDKDNRIWIGTENGGLSLFNRKDGSFDNYQNEVYNPFSISQKTVSCIIQDDQKNIWIGTHRGGINILSQHQNKFQFYSQGINNRSLSFKDIKCFLEAENGKVFIGTDGGGLNIWDRPTNTFRHYQHNSGDGSSISSNAVLSVLQDKQGSIWVGTWQGGLNKFDPASGQFKSYRNNTQKSNSVSPDNIWKIFEYDDNTLWLGTSFEGLSVYHKQTRAFNRLRYSVSGRSEIYGENITDIERDNDNNIWIATSDGGLNKYNQAKDTIEHFFVKRNNGSLFAVAVGSVFIDNEGTVWVANENGLYSYDQLKNNFTPFLFEEASGFKIKSIEQDKYGFLWCGTQNGLIKITKQSGRIQRFTNADALQGLDFGLNSSIILKSGDLVFGGYNGFNIFDPAEITINAHPPKVYVTNLTALNNNILPSNAKDAILKRQILDSGSITLNHNQSALFSFEFAALNFVATEKNQYAYKLDGFDDDWNYIGNQHKITFTNLDPGTYRLRIIASNNDGVWNKQGAVIKINILPPFWKTWWFNLSAVLLVLTIAFIYFKMYRNLLARKMHEKKQEEMYNMQLDFFTHISHEFRTPLSLILGATEKMQERDSEHIFNKYYDLLHRNINRMVNLVKEIMDFRKVESGIIKLHVEETFFENTIRQIAEDFIPVAETKGVQFELNIHEEKNTLAWIDKLFIERITANLLNNAIKYTDKGGCVSIEVLYTMDNFTPEFKDNALFTSDHHFDHYLLIRVKDSGIGISPQSLTKVFERFYRVPNTQLGSGIGLAFVQRLTYLHKGFIRIFSEKNKGTDIIVAIPYRKEYYNEEEKNIKEGVDSRKLELPKIEAHEYGEIPELVTKAPQISKKEHDIIIVDDNDELRTFLKSCLTDEYNVHEASNGLEGLQKIEDINPSLIITDIMMPVMDGFEMCRRVKQNENTNHIPVIMLTAKDGEESKMEGVDSGADYYFTKPLSTKLLFATIQNIFQFNLKLRSHFLKDYQQEIRDSIKSAKEREVVSSILLVIDNNLSDPDFSVEQLCKNVGMSKTKLYTIVKSATGKSLNEFIRTIRLKKAVYIMTSEDVTISEVMNRVGILSASYFSKAFKNEHGFTPTEYYSRLKTKTLNENLSDRMN